MATASAVNVTDGPLPIDGEGHVLAGGERGDVDTSVPSVVAAVLRGALLVEDRVLARLRDAADDAEQAPEPVPTAVEPETPKASDSKPRRASASAPTSGASA